MKIKDLQCKICHKPFTTLSVIVGITLKTIHTCLTSAEKDLWQKVITKYTCVLMRVVGIRVNTAARDLVADKIYSITCRNILESTDLHAEFVGKG